MAQLHFLKAAPKCGLSRATGCPGRSWDAHPNPTPNPNLAQRCLVCAGLPQGAAAPEPGAARQLPARHLCAHGQGRAGKQGIRVRVARLACSWEGSAACWQVEGWTPVSMDRFMPVVDMWQDGGICFAANARMTSSGYADEPQPAAPCCALRRPESLKAVPAYRLEVVDRRAKSRPDM